MELRQLRYCVRVMSIGMAPTTVSVLGLPLVQAMRDRDPDVQLHLVESLSFLTMPYSKFAHGFFRSAALLRYAVEKRKASFAKADAS